MISTHSRPESVRVTRCAPLRRRRRRTSSSNARRRFRREFKCSLGGIHPLLAAGATTQHCHLGAVRFRAPSHHLQHSQFALNPNGSSDSRPRQRTTVGSVLKGRTRDHIPSHCVFLTLADTPTFLVLSTHPKLDADAKHFKHLFFPLSNTCAQKPCSE